MIAALKLFSNQFLILSNSLVGQHTKTKILKSMLLTIYAAAYIWLCHDKSTKFKKMQLFQHVNFKNNCHLNHVPFA